MTENPFNVFINNVNIFEISQHPFVSDLFDSIGCKLSSESNNELIKNWMSGKNQGFRKDFAGNLVTQDLFDSCFNYLANSVGHRFNEAQDKLKEAGIEYPLIDFETDEKKAFVKSLVYQFVEIENLRLDDSIEPYIKKKPEPANKVPVNEDANRTNG